MESLELLLRRSTVLNAGEKFRDDDQINDQGRCEEGIFADRMHRNGIATAHHEFGMILIHGHFGVSHCRDIFDYNAVVYFAANFVVEEDLIGGNNIVDNGGFADFLGAELARGRQILAIVVS